MPYLGHALVENRNGLIAAAMVTLRSSSRTVEEWFWNVR
jgi:hypothetical protein